MLRNTPFAGTPTIKLILGLGLCSLGGAMLYVYFKQQDDDEDAAARRGKGAAASPNKKALNRNTSSSANNNSKVQPQKPVTITVEMTNEQITLIVGRGGANLSGIEERTGTQISFRDKSAAQKYCDITGATAAAVQEARSLLLNEMERAPIVRVVVEVPQSVCGAVTGRCGAAMQEICRLSHAKVAVESPTTAPTTTAGAPGGDGVRRLTITGTQQQVAVARQLIEQKIAEDAALRQAVDEVEQRREPRRDASAMSQQSGGAPSSRYSSQQSLALAPRDKLLAAAGTGPGSGDEKPLEVYVSAVASPSKFWLQLIGPQTRRLDEMVAAMSDYYAVAENRAAHRIDAPYLGQIVAAVFKYDGKWYRAVVVAILPHEFDPNALVLDLYFVDYGDSEYAAPHEVYELRTDFLTLRFQAVECFLAGVRSTLSEGGNGAAVRTLDGAEEAAGEQQQAPLETWAVESIQKFEEMTQVANWKKLIARVVTYKERAKPLDAATPCATALQREASPIPGVELYDAVDGTEFNIGQALIWDGYALPLDPLQRRPASRSLGGGAPSTAATSPASSVYEASMTPPQTPTPPPPTAVSPPPQKEEPAAFTTTKDAAATVTAAAEDALMQRQMEHLQRHKLTTAHKNNNNNNNNNHSLYLNGTSSPAAALTHAPTAATTATTPVATNGNAHDASG